MKVSTALLFVSFLVCQLALIVFSPLNLSPDESHYWEWSKRLDLAYYSKGPLVALLIRGSTVMFGDTEIAVRLPALLCSVLFYIVVYQGSCFLFNKSGNPAAQESRDSLILLPVILAGSCLMFSQMGLLMTTDAPAALAWAVALCSAILAVSENPRWWLLFGLAVGVGALAKYTVLILPVSIVIALLFTKPVRKHLLDPYLWIGGLLGLLLLVPVVWWNTEHDWANLLHNRGHVVAEKKQLKIGFLFELIGSQLGLVGPVTFVGFVWLVIWGWRRWRREGDAVAGLLLWSILPLLTLCVLTSFTKRVYANWPLPAYIGAAFLLGHALASVEYSPKQLLICKYAFRTNAFLLLLGYAVYMGATFGLPPEILPSKKLVGWSAFGKSIERLNKTQRLNKTEQLGQKQNYLIADDYGVASAAAFYGGTRSYCAFTSERRMNQYDVWGGWNHLKGENVLLVSKSAEFDKSIASRFETVEPLGSLKINWSGGTLREFHFFRGVSYDGTTPPMPAKR
jgi:4-amino-4-deoxy-L-arabinose transferase-like glycosyltransferase